ncbi:MAG: VacJ family lipoprotein, partial [Geminicoccaceae bacterium]|nr:VacJ family lipoprotein [Geminicoccaceae bacterium]
MRPGRALAGALLLLALSACSSGPAEQIGQTAASRSASGQTALDPVEPAEAVEEEPLLTSVPDPLEPLNRAIYRFNFELDSYVLLPIVNAYRYVVPEFLRTGVSNFFNNLLEVTNANNGLLQARPEIASRAVIRFAVNSTVGVLGFFDVATKLGVT